MVGATAVNYQWSIFLASLDPTTGSEQAGKRPVIVISREQINQRLSVVNVLPLTSRKSSTRLIYPNEVLLPAGSASLKVESIVLSYQIRTLDKSRLERRLGTLSEEHLRSAILEALRFQLEM
jgi:mRNA interferase MazF